MTQEQNKHRTVLLDEAIDALNIKPSGCYVDGTFGRGGHSAAILVRLGAEGSLYGFDKDEEAIEFARQHFADDPRFHIMHAGFSQLKDVAVQYKLVGRIDGLLLDLGVSSPQLDDAGRGFSFMQDGPLDMRMNTTEGESAAEWLAHAEESEITKVLKDYGEERFARRIARSIVAYRKEHSLNTTRQLADLVSQSIPVKEKHKHPATRTFQAIRIFINGELEELQQCLKQALEVLAAGARLVVISFHSLEDRIVKRFMRDAARGEPYPKGLPVTGMRKDPVLKLVGGAKRPSEQEVEVNPRARSAVMRVAEMLS